MGAEKLTVELMLDQEKIHISTSCDLAEKAAKWDEARHCNADWELHLILAGECTVDLEDVRLRLCRNQALLIAPGQYHRSKATPGEFLRFTLSFLPSRGDLMCRLEEAVPQYLVLSVEDQMRGLAQNFFTESAEKNSFYQSYQKSLLEQIGLLFFRKVNIAKRTERSTAGETSKSRNDLIDDYFQRHFREKSGEEKLASLLHLSRRQLVRVLEKNYGMNFRQKITRSRMDYASWLLRTTNQKISQISEMAGYASEATFFQVFRSHFGMTPKQYRNQKKDL